MSSNDRHRLMILTFSAFLLFLGFFQRAPLHVAGVQVTDNILFFLAACGMLIGFGAIQVVKLWRSGSQR